MTAIRDFIPGEEIKHSRGIPLKEDGIMFYDSPEIRKYNNLVAIMEEAMREYSGGTY